MSAEAQHLIDSRNETDVLSSFIKYGAKNLLAHPLTETYLHLKWFTVRRYFYVNFFFYILYVLTLTALTIWTSQLKYHDKEWNCTTLYNQTNEIYEYSLKLPNTTGKYIKECFDFKMSPYNDSNTFISKVPTGEDFGKESITSFQYFLDEQSPNSKRFWNVLWITNFIATSFITLRELGQLLSTVQETRSLKYFKSSENILETLALVFTWTYLVMVVEFNELDQIFGGIAMFLAWFELTLLLGRFPSIGMYTYMSLHVIKQLIPLFFFVFFCTLMGFAMTFHMLLIRDYNGVFDNPWTSYLKVK